VGQLACILFPISLAYLHGSTFMASKRKENKLLDTIDKKKKKKCKRLNWNQAAILFNSSVLHCGKVYPSGGCG
jgi:hypothetical protein